MAIKFKNAALLGVAAPASVSASAPTEQVTEQVVDKGIGIYPPAGSVQVASQHLQAPVSEAVQVQAPADDLLTQKVQEFIEIDGILKTYSEMIKRHAELKTELAAHVKADETEGEVQLIASNGVVVFSGHSKDRTIPEEMKNAAIGAVKTACGYETLIAAIGLSAAKLESLLGKPAAEPFIKVGKGSRSLKAVVKNP